MKRLPCPSLLFALVSVLAAIFLSTGVAEAAALNCGAWSIVASPSPSSLNNFLAGVAVLSAGNVWAVGTEYNSSNVAQTLVEHWNGSRWSIVKSPSPDPNNNFLNGVAALSSNNLWAVGNDGGNGGKVLTLIEHWNGSKWSIVKSPNPSATESVLKSVAAVSASNVWAVGSTSNSSGIGQTLIEHWNGSKWSIVSSPNPSSSDNELNGVVAVSSSNVWAVGLSVNNSSGNYQTLIEHWDGSQWSVISSPNVGSSGNVLKSVAAISASDIWAVGYENGQTLTEHWNGSQWSIVFSPNIHALNNDFFSVTTISTSNVWAVGYAQNTPDSNAQTLIENWNGTQWSIVSSPNLGSGSSLLFGVARVPTTKKVWAVGDGNGSQFGFQTLTEFYCP
jgi:hypothetical protein